MPDTLGRSSHRAPLLLYLLSPPLHIHLQIHRRGRCQMPLGWLALACAPIQRAEAAVAVSNERAHLELGGEAQRLVVVGPGALGVGEIGGGSDLCEDPQAERLVASVARV